MLITAVEPQKKRSDRLNVYVDGEFRCGVAAEVLRRAGIKAGDEVDAATLERLERDEQAARAYDAALRLLSHRSRTRKELRDRLVRKNFAPPVTEACLERLADDGLIDDREFAESWVRDRVRLKPRGRRGLILELRRKGVAESMASSAVDRVFAAEGVSERELADRAAEKWRRRASPRMLDALGAGRGHAGYRRARRRIRQYLARRGFSAQVAHEVLEMLAEDL